MYYDLGKNNCICIFYVYCNLIFSVKLIIVEIKN